MTGKDMLKSLRQAGWIVKRVNGSHHHLVHPDHPGKLVTVPVHGYEELDIKTLHSIRRQAGLK